MLSEVVRLVDGFGGVDIPVTSIVLLILSSLNVTVSLLCTVKLFLFVTTTVIS